VSIVAPFYEQGDIQGACDKLTSVAVDRWQEEEEMIDDITFIIIFLN
jgi:hypothetical protein